MLLAPEFPWGPAYHKGDGFLHESSGVQQIPSSLTQPDAAMGPGMSSWDSWSNLSVGEGREVGDARCHNATTGVVPLCPMSGSVQ